MPFFFSILSFNIVFITLLLFITSQLTLTIVARSESVSAWNFDYVILKCLKEPVSFLIGQDTTTPLSRFLHYNSLRDEIISNHRSFRLVFYNLISLMVQLNNSFTLSLQFVFLSVIRHFLHSRRSMSCPLLIDFFIWNEHLVRNLPVYSSHRVCFLPAVNKCFMVLWTFFSFLSYEKLIWRVWFFCVQMWTQFAAFWLKSSLCPTCC